MKNIWLIFILILAGCGNTKNLTTITVPELENYVFVPAIVFDVDQKRNKSIITTASAYIGLHGRYHQKTLKDLMGIDPLETAWCAAFVNSILHKLEVPGSESVSNWPLVARSFLRWGIGVSDPQPGDVVVFARGNQSWQGHVGFYYGYQYQNGQKYFLILGGNQRNTVSIILYPASEALSIRRAQG